VLKVRLLPERAQRYLDRAYNAERYLKRLIHDAED